MEPVSVSCTAVPAASASTGPGTKPTAWLLEGGVEVGVGESGTARVEKRREGKKRGESGLFDAVRRGE